MREKSYDSQRQNETCVTLRNWRGTRRFFTGERGAWSSRCELSSPSYPRLSFPVSPFMCRQQEQYQWKIDRTENFARMRRKLARNYNFDRHLDASHQRDLGSAPPAEEPQATDTTLLSLARASGRSASVQEEEDLLLEQLWLNSGADKLEVRGEDRRGGLCEPRFLLPLASGRQLTFK